MLTLILLLASNHIFMLQKSNKTTCMVLQPSIIAFAFEYFLEGLCVFEFWLSFNHIQNINTKICITVSLRWHILSLHLITSQMMIMDYCNRSFITISIYSRKLYLKLSPSLDLYYGSMCLHVWRLHLPICFWCWQRFWVKYSLEVKNKTFDFDDDRWSRHLMWCLSCDGYISRFYLMWSNDGAWSVRCHLMR